VIAGPMVWTNGPLDIPLLLNQALASSAMPAVARILNTALFGREGHVVEEASTLYNATDPNGLGQGGRSTMWSACET